MRISTSMIYDSGVSSIQKKTTDLLKIQQQLATGRRLLTPSDDPVAAAHALEVSQAKDLNTQFADNQKNAKDMLALSEGQMQGVDDMLQRVHELTVQLGSPALSDNDRASIATELRQRFGELMGIANEQDGTGQYLYSGYLGGTRPFVGSVDTGVTYQGDDGQRQLQVSGSRVLDVSDSGNAIFMSPTDASVPFATVADAQNRGTASIGSATVSDSAKWNAATNGKSYNITFAVVGAVTTYDIVDDSGISLLTNAAATMTAPLPGTYQNGAAIDLKSQVIGGMDYGAAVTISGAPSNGDVFRIRSSAPVSVFKTLSDLIRAAETPAGTAGSTATSTMSQQVAVALANLSTAQDNVLRVRANIGARLNELDSLASINGQRELDYADTISRLQEVDYTSAITDLNKNQVNLQAAQQSFMKISQLSLFNYL